MTGGIFRFIGYFSMCILILIVALLALSFSGVIGSRNIFISTFVTVLFEQPFLIPSCLIILPSFLWKRSLFLGYSVTLGALLFTVWAINEYQRQQSQYADSGAGEAFGLAIFAILGFAYALGIIVRVLVYTSISFIKSKKPKTAFEKYD
jgi:hypothetical protein